jgi:hypothetical protein
MSILAPNTVIPAKAGHEVKGQRYPAYVSTFIAPRGCTPAQPKALDTG